MRVFVKNDVGRTWIAPLLHVASVTKVALAYAVVAAASLNWPSFERHSHDRTVLYCMLVPPPQIRAKLRSCSYIFRFDRISVILRLIAVSEISEHQEHLAATSPFKIWTLELEAFKIGKLVSPPFVTLIIQAGKQCSLPCCIRNCASTKRVLPRTTWSSDERFLRSSVESRETPWTITLGSVVEDQGLDCVRAVHHHQ
uniref:Uncharacterized protein n=1 Tax=Ixodes ricinus TaxID=34613 RepID=A0A6B0V2B1_IXORI